jgi:hypothetical protein
VYIRGTRPITAAQLAALEITILPIEKEGVMYTLIKSISLRYLVVEQLPAIGISLVIAEVFYKFHSFTLECIAFLATWFVLDVAIKSILDFFSKRSDIVRHDK